MKKDQNQNMEDEWAQAQSQDKHPWRVGVVFGSRSVEHEVSIITATQLMENMPGKYQAVPLYIDKRGRWWTGEVLKAIETFRELDLENPADLPGIKKVNFVPEPGANDWVDLIVMAVHGGMSEDGTLAGLFELADIPYVGPGVTGAALATDKIATKHLAESMGLQVTKYGWFTAFDWRVGQQHVLEHITDLSFPLFVKPASLGSSVGVQRVKNQDELISAIDLALEFDERIIVEEAAPEDAIEVNIAVLGLAEDCQASVSEQPLQSDDFLSYADKYEKGCKGKDGGSKGMAGLTRQIPAPITNKLQEELQEAACQIWKTIAGFGVARIDFFADPSSEQFWVGEINSPPGSMAYYLWEVSGLGYPQLIESLILIAKQRHQQRQGLFSSIKSNILSKK